MISYHHPRCEYFFAKVNSTVCLLDVTSKLRDDDAISALVDGMTTRNDDEKHY